LGRGGGLFKGRRRVAKQKGTGKGNSAQKDGFSYNRGNDSSERRTTTLRKRRTEGEGGTGLAGRVVARRGQHPFGQRYPAEFANATQSVKD